MRNERSDFRKGSYDVGAISYGMSVRLVKDAEGGEEGIETLRKKKRNVQHADFRHVAFFYFEKMLKNIIHAHKYKE